MSLIRGRRYNRKKKAAHGNSGGANQHTKQLGKTSELLDCQTVTQAKESTAERLAAEHGVSERTIHRDGQFATNVEALKPFVPEIEQMVMAGETTKTATTLEQHPE